jgi:hypothetical protein
MTPGQQPETIAPNGETEAADPPSGPEDFRRRAVWLVVCLVAGGTVGLVGQTLTGKDLWYLALPGAVALGWLYFGRPENCSRCENAEPRPGIPSRS